MHTTVRYVYAGLPTESVERRVVFVAVWSRPRQDAGGLVTFQQLQEQCAERVRQLDVPIPFDLSALCDSVGRSRGRDVELVPMPLPAESPCGMWVDGDTVDLIFYDTQTSAPHAEHIVLHELGHLVCEHEPVSLSEEDASRLVLPHLDPQSVQRVLGRSAYSAVEEQEAELVATLIGQRVERTQAVSRPAPDSTAARLARALEGPSGG